MMRSTDDDARWDAILAEGPAAFIERILRENGGEPSEDQQEDLCAAATMAVSAQLVRAGADIDDVERQFTERDHSFHFALTNGDLEVTVEWEVEDDDACPEDPDGLHFIGCGCEAS